MAEGSVGQSAQAGGAQTVQLRRYAIAPGRADDFIRSWSSQIPALRRKHGFEITFALLDRKNHVFAWAVAIDGDRDAFLAAEQAYYAPPERQRISQNGTPGYARQTLPQWLSARNPALETSLAGAQRHRP